MKPYYDFNSKHIKLKRREIKKNIAVIKDFEIKPPIRLTENEIDQQVTKKKVFGFIQLRLVINTITKGFEDFIYDKINKKGETLKIQVANNREIADILHVYNRSFLTSNSPFETITMDYMEALQNVPEVTFYLARKNGIPAGFMILDFEGDNNEYGFITALGILPRYQGKGIGLALAARAWNHFKEKNIEELRCEVYYQNEKSFGFLKSLNFQEFSIR